MKKLRLFEDQDLASHIFCLCPGMWQAQYDLTEDTVPQSQSVCKLLEALGCIEQPFPMEREQATKKGKTNTGNSIEWNVVSFLKHIPKKKRPDVKHCVL